MEHEPTGWMVTGLLGGGAVRMLFVEAGEPAAHTQRVHGLGPDAARFGAEVTVAAALLGAYVKGEEQLTLQIQGDQPPLSAYADLTAGGALRVRVSPPDLRRRDDRFRGVLSVVKHVGEREVWRGMTSIDDTSVGDALSHHLGGSAQVDAALGIVVRLEEGAVVGAGGWLVERLPEDPAHPSLTAEAFRERYGWLRTADPGDVFSRLHTGGLSPEDRVTLLEQRPLVWRCRCTVARIEGMLVGLGPDTLQQMIDEDHGAEITCHFCQRRHRVDEQRLRALRASIAVA
jgi:molecular chaperone Hsp33